MLTNDICDSWTETQSWVCCLWVLILNIILELLWVVALCSQIEVYRIFGGACRLCHLIWDHKDRKLQNGFIVDVAFSVRELPVLWCCQLVQYFEAPVRIPRLLNAEMGRAALSEPLYVCHDFDASLLHAQICCCKIITLDKSSVSVVVKQRSDQSGFNSQQGQELSSSRHNIRTCSGALPASCPMVGEGFYSWNKRPAAIIINVRTNRPFSWRSYSKVKSR